MLAALGPVMRTMLEVFLKLTYRLPSGPSVLPHGRLPPRPHPWARTVRSKNEIPPLPLAAAGSYLSRTTPRLFDDRSHRRRRRGGRNATTTAADTRSAEPRAVAAPLHRDRRDAEAALVERAPNREKTYTIGSLVAAGESSPMAGARGACSFGGRWGLRREHGRRSAVISIRAQRS